MKGEEPMKGEELWGLTQASESESRGKYPEDEGSCHEAEEEQGRASDERSGKDVHANCRNKTIKHLFFLFNYILILLGMQAPKNKWMRR